MKLALVLTVLALHVTLVVGGWGDWGNKGGSDTKTTPAPTKPPKDSISCLECAYIVDEVVAGISEKLTKEEPIPFIGVNPCKDCYFIGGATLTSQNDACVYKDPGNKKCLLQSFTVKFGMASIRCNCTLPTAIDEFLKTLKETGTEISNVKWCDITRAHSRKKSQKKFKPRSHSDFPACTPKVSSVVGGAESIGTSEKTAEASAGATWADVEAEIIIRRCKNEESVLKKINILNTNYEDIVTDCTTIDPNVAETCSCCAQCDFLRQLLVKATENLLPCLLNSKDDRVAGIVQELQCQTDSLSK